MVGSMRATRKGVMEYEYTNNSTMTIILIIINVNIIIIIMSIIIYSHIMLSDLVENVPCIV